MSYLVTTIRECVRKKTTITAKELVAKGVPAVLIPGLVLAMALGWKGNELRTANTFNTVTEVFPYRGTVASVIDGDTFTITTGQSVRLLALNAPDRGNPIYQKAKEELTTLLPKNKPVYLEYDRYQDDKYGRILAWVWINCEAAPEFLPSDYMHKSNNESNPGLTVNPKKCAKGTMVNEYMAKKGYGVLVTYKDRGELKYEKRIQEVLQ